MPLVFVVLLLGMLLVALPHFWVNRVMDRHAVDRPDLGGTGSEFARHALDALKLGDVKVEETQLGNHYDPVTRAVRLEPRFMKGRSLSAIVVAAHEVGHAMQDAMGLPIFRHRQTIAKRAQLLNVIGQAFLWSAPLLVMIGKGRAAMILNVVGFGAMALLSFAMQAITLPVEFDASFKRALPLLERGRFIHSHDMRPARQLLRAAAFTYVAGLLRTIVTIRGIGPVWRL